MGLSLVPLSPPNPTFLRFDRDGGRGGTTRGTEVDSEVHDESVTVVEEHRVDTLLPTYEHVCLRELGTPV